MNKKRIACACMLLMAGFSTTLYAQKKSKQPRQIQQVGGYSKPIPMPQIPVVQPVNTVPMGDWRGFEEVKLDLQVAPGPFAPTWSSIEQHYPGEPEWLREAKFGIWVHFGPQSAGMSGDWYARYLYNPGKRAYQNHIKNYGHPAEVGYKDVLKNWNPVKLDPAPFTKIYQDAGAKFLMIQGVHHDNYDLWNSQYHPWNSVQIGPKRDLLGEWASACRSANMRFGVTFHHEYSWWWWQTAYGADTVGPAKGVPYDGHLTLADGKGKWWDGYDPKLLYGIDLREYIGVDQNAHRDWTPAPAGIFSRHQAYAKWYATQWALRMMDVVANYDPDFIYTDGTVQGPFTGNGTGTGFKCDAMQRVIADYYNRTLSRRGQVNTFSIVKFRKKTNGTVNTEEHGIPANIKTDQPWIAEAPVGDWFYAPGFIYKSEMVIRYVVEAIARDGNAAVNIVMLPDGSLDPQSLQMLQEVGVWMRRNGEAVYGSRAWVIPGEGEQVNGKLKMIPGGAINKRHADFSFSVADFRFTVGKNNALYAFCMAVPQAGTQVIIKSLGKAASHLGRPVQSVELLGFKGSLSWKQEQDGLVITYPAGLTLENSIVFKIN